MTRLEQLLRDTMIEGARVESPSPDLFARVTDSIAADRARRRRGRRLAAGWLGAICTLAVVIGVATPRDDKGMHMPWWVLEIAQTLVLIGLAVWLGPFIKRFGRAYAADVFRGSPMTGKSYIVLTDVVYYLIFSAYILLTLRFEPEEGWHAAEVSAAQLQDSVAEVAGILLIIGILHGLNILVLPVLGRLFSLNRRLDESARERPRP